MKTALILPYLDHLSQVYGGMTTIKRELLFPEGSILSYLPSFEGQAHTYFDDYGCVSNSLETGGQVLIKRLIDTFSKDNRDWFKLVYYSNNEPNFSNRDLIVLSETKPGIGNSGDKVLKTAQERGLIPQTMGEWDTASRDTKNTLEEFYSYKRALEAEKVAEEWLKRSNLTGEWVERDKWEEASKEGVLQVYVNAWYVDQDGKYYNPTNRHNHAVLMADYKDKKILDSYKPEIKELRSWDDAYYWALKINIKENYMEKPTINNNTLVQEVTKSGQFGLFLDGKILVGGAGEILATFYMRNGGDTKGKTKPLTAEQWAMFDKYDLKGNKVS